jgi:transcriptional regulator with XRE-family HTH domain
MQNGFVEGFNCTYRDEVLDFYVFSTLREVQEITEGWIADYNQQRPHESLKDLTPCLYTCLNFRRRFISLDRSISVRYLRTHISGYRATMEETFGKKLRRLRLDADMGLRELARLIDKSPGYLSDVEGDRVAPPSETIIIQIAKALQVEGDELLSAAMKIDPDVTSYVAKEPWAADFLRMARNRHYSKDDWDRLKQLAEISQLGKKDDKTK